MPADREKTSSGRARRVLALALIAGVAAPAVALAALPGKNTSFESHDHTTKGRNWHVQMEVGKDRQRIDALVGYAEVCGETVFKEKVPISDAGDVAASGSVKNGSWNVTARFTSSTEVSGTFQLVKGSCDTGPLAFTAKLNGDGHANHDHSGGGGGGHHNHGPKYPDIKGATREQRRQAERLRRDALDIAATKFSSYRKARAQKFHRFRRKWKRPVLFHLRYPPYDRDRHIFNANRPESLVYWWPRKGDPILLGIMFRVNKGKRPAFGGPIPIYHQHSGRDGSLGDPMTHVWLTDTLKSAWANCLPVEQLEMAIPRFRYETPRQGVSGAEGIPCEPQPEDAK